MDTETSHSYTKTYSLDEAFSFCAAVTASHHENFPVASLFLPGEKRPYIQAIYAFSRIADDIADELEMHPDERLQKLDDWEQQLLGCFEGRADHPVFIALRETVNRVGIPIEPLQHLLAAFKKDVVQHSYETFEDLLGYCRCSANPVGRLVLMIFGYRNEVLHNMSDDICTALQLTNFWQDVAVDLEKNRLYIPLEDMRKFGYSNEDWHGRIWNDRFQALMKFQTERTRALFYHGGELPSRVDRDLQLELKLVWLGGMSILKNIERMHYNLFQRRPRLNGFNKLMILIRGLLMKDVTRFGKSREEWEQTLQ